MGAAEASFTREAQVSLQCVLGPEQAPRGMGKAEVYPSSTAYPLLLFLFKCCQNLLQNPC